MHVELGKIRSAEFGLGGYQDVQIVFQIHVGGKAWGSTLTYECGWGHVSKEDLEKPDSSYKWTHEERLKTIGEKAWEVFELMRKAKVKHLSDLVDIPIRAYFDGPCGRIEKIEIMEEVL